MDPVDIQDIQADERQAVSVTINSRVEVKKLRGFSIATAYAKDYTGTIKLTWFNCPFCVIIFILEIVISLSEK